MSWGKSRPFREIEQYHKMFKLIVAICIHSFIHHAFLSHSIYLSIYLSPFLSITLSHTYVCVYFYIELPTTDLYLSVSANHSDT